MDTPKRLTITEEQINKFSDYTDKWLKIGYKSGLVVNHERVRHHIEHLTDHKYSKYIWCDSYMSAIVMALFKEKQGIELWKDNKQCLNWRELESIAKKHFSIIDLNAWTQEKLYTFLFGSHDAAWLAYCDFFKSEFPQLDFDKRLDDLIALAEEAGWIMASDDICYICERPVIKPLDDQGRGHCEDGPYVSYSDGFSMYYWHGTHVPDYWIEPREGKKLTAAEALNWPNIEQRRCACEILGWHNILRELDAKVIDDDGDPQIGVLIEVEIPQIGKEKFLRVECGTKREFALPVPPEMTTALEAQAWTWDLTLEDFVKPEVRT